MNFLIVLWITHETKRISQNLGLTEMESSGLHKLLSVRVRLKILSVMPYILLAYFIPTIYFGLKWISSFDGLCTVIEYVCFNSTMSFLIFGFVTGVICWNLWAFMSYPFGQWKLERQQELQNLLFQKDIKKLYEEQLSHNLVFVRSIEKYRTKLIMVGL